MSFYFSAEVKNLNFSTTEEALKKAFRKVPGFRSAVIMRKKAAVTKKKGAVKEDVPTLSTTKEAR